MQVFIVRFCFTVPRQERASIVAVKATYEEANDYISRTGMPRNNFRIETWDVGAEEGLEDDLDE